MNLKFITAPDSFKGTMRSVEVCAIMEKAILSVFPGAQVLKVPIADGGEGTVEAFLTALGGTWVEKNVTGPLFSPVKARYGLLPAEKPRSLKWRRLRVWCWQGKARTPLKPPALVQASWWRTRLIRGAKKLF